MTASRQVEECRHFTGIQHPTCGAGVDYKAVRDASQPGPYRWPCLTLIGREPATTTCGLRSLLTREEHAAREKEIEAICAKAAADVAAGRCHVCGGGIEPSRVVGRCRYAACGHRVGQVLDESEEP